jgi:acyl-CoA hydrolase
MIDLGAFDELEDISIFSEMAAPGMGDLVRRGIATGKYATLHPGKAVFSGLIGMRRDEILWADDNPLFELYSSDYTVNIANVSRNENMVSINNATQVDLTGQITCETQFGPRLINGPGGQIEFHIGAFAAPGGRAVTLLPSTWEAGGGVSTIVPQLDGGSLVSIPRVFADTIVTEWGVAELIGKTHRERAEALIRIAHPDFRQDLQKAAQNIF